jgi:hypothetical protein
MDTQLHTQEVTGSSPVAPTIRINRLRPHIPETASTTSTKVGGQLGGLISCGPAGDRLVLVTPHGDRIAIAPANFCVFKTHYRDRRATVANHLIFMQIQFSDHTR